MQHQNPPIESTLIAFTDLGEIRKWFNDFTPRHRAAGLVDHNDTLDAGIYRAVAGKRAAG